VFTPTPTGLGERVHLARPDVNLDTHIQDIVNLLLYEDLDNVVLVGWSYGGMVITGVLDRVAERLTRVVHLDAEVPLDGESEFSISGPELRVWMEQSAQSSGEGWKASVGDPEAPSTLSSAGGSLTRNEAVVCRQAREPAYRNLSPTSPPLQSRWRGGAAHVHPVPNRRGSICIHLRSHGGTLAERSSVARP
jgi:pimeloyl-ACP methyl ester carboxylesterase